MQAWKNPIVQKRLTGSVQNYEFMHIFYSNIIIVHYCL